MYRSDALHRHRLKVLQGIDWCSARIRAQFSAAGVSKRDICAIVDSRQWARNIPLDERESGCAGNLKLSLALASGRVGIRNRWIPRFCRIAVFVVAVAL